MPVKPQYAKDVARAVMRRYPEVVSTDFEQNKQVVAAVTNIESKRVRNRVAGYITTETGRRR